MLGVYGSSAARTQCSSATTAVWKSSAILTGSAQRQPGETGPGSTGGQRRGFAAKAAGRWRVSRGQKRSRMYFKVDNMIARLCDDRNDAEEGKRRKITQARKEELLAHREGKCPGYLHGSLVPLLRVCVYMSPKMKLMPFTCHPSAPFSHAAALSNRNHLPLYRSAYTFQMGTYNVASVLTGLFDLG